MKNNQDINNLTAGVYKQIVAPIYTNDTETTLETGLANGVVAWKLIGVKGAVLITKTSNNNGGITVNVPESGYIVIEIDEQDTAALTSGDYYHIAELTIGGVTLGVFDGIVSIDNRVGGD